MKLDFDSFWINLENKAAAKKYKLACWHKWFAWYPVRIGECDHRWLETIERRVCTEFDFTFSLPQLRIVREYREIKD